MKIYIVWSLYKGDGLDQEDCMWAPIAFKTLKAAQKCYDECADDLTVLHCLLFEAELYDMRGYNKLIQEVKNDDISVTKEIFTLFDKFNQQTRSAA